MRGARGESNVSRGERCFLTKKVFDYLRISEKSSNFAVVFGDTTDGSNTMKGETGSNVLFLLFDFAYD